MRRQGNVVIVGIAVGLFGTAACSLDLGGTLGAGDDAGALVGTFLDASSFAGEASVASGDSAAPSDGSGGAYDAFSDARSEGAAPDAGCTGVLCSGVCLNASTCASCAAGHALCAKTRVCGDCSDCKDEQGKDVPVACFACDANHQNPVGTCQPNDTSVFCLDSYYPAGKTHCPCPSFDVAQCPGKNQVCVQVGSNAPVCVSCGETYYATDMAVCQGSASCRVGSAAPVCK